MAVFLEMESMELAEIERRMPKKGLRDGGDWLLSPKPLVLEKKEVKAIESMGHSLALFQRACETVYQRSAKGTAPAWIVDWLDRGKPEWMVELQRSVGLSDVVPRVIRPDLMWTEDGFCVTELDGVPGGMGLLEWLSEIYGEWDLLGEGMAQCFGELMGGCGDVLVSEEAGDYRLEMEYLAARAGAEGALTLKGKHNLEQQAWRIEQAETFWKNKENRCEEAEQRSMYRFFEWFDWKNIGGIEEMAQCVGLTSPCKPHLEEKMWLALLHVPSLQGLWRESLRGNHLKRVQSIVPYGWIVDPTPLPPFAALPKLNVASWAEVGKMSQKERELVLKVSGFSEKAWGSRGVTIGHDVSAEEWQAKIAEALAESALQPSIVQEYKGGRRIKHPYFDRDTGKVKVMEGRVRLCPYFFITKERKTKLGGVLATICPADKKKIHGMKDSILVPVARA